ncbi:hypothetical protein [Spirillospora sp. CA-294931]|uniref:hypothetical protein n=1 Tax=Spirillospora sp. CA-294931 TaxID=3240042 RepID=UPI003D8E280A
MAARWFLTVVQSVLAELKNQDAQVRIERYTSRTDTGTATTVPQEMSIERTDARSARRWSSPARRSWTQDWRRDY